MCTSAFAHSDSDISGQGRGRRQAAAGSTHGQGRGLPCALPPLHTGIRHTSGMVRHCARGRGGRQTGAGRTHGQGRGLPGALPPLRTVIRHTSGMVRHCARGRPPLPSPSPTLRTAARDTVPQRHGLFSGATRTLPGSSRRANDILYIRVRRREGENVLHRAASNDVDNFSVDNPLWITAAAGCRLFCGGRGRRCGGSVNAGAEVQTRTGRVRKSFGGRPKAVRGKCERGRGSANADGAGAKAFAGDGYSQKASFGPMAAISRHGPGGRIYKYACARAAAANVR